MRTFDVTDTGSVFWGAGIVLFLAKMINLHDEIKQGFWVELCQQVETGAFVRGVIRRHELTMRSGLFTATSIGFIPFRIMDTYRAQSRLPFPIRPC